ncbi:hypothetical protein ZOSMA_133G00090 [Zostera marina]|uniref:Proline-rich protein n=1 Tax=Zostera marina TaxID=29655 RepID=A0A0K9Q140_ZOSMR|nr:hypothetical protein ZOSMA_133G00090 [Zostera marina]
MWKTGFFLLAVTLLIVTAASAIPTDSDKVAKLVGVAECVDCRTNDFKGILLAVVCKSETNEEDFKEVAFGEFGRDGKLSVQLPTTLVDRQCYAHVRSVSKNNPCPTLRHPDNFTLSLSSNDQSVYVLGTDAGKVPFSRAACVQKTFWNGYHINCPDHPWFKYLPYCKKRDHREHHKKPSPCKPPPVHKEPPPCKPPPVHKEPPPCKPPVYKKPPPYMPPAYKAPPPY